ncbi:MAG: family N-acetyltransferase, partial [Oerskovia sp.]|nr:family N-acetyltransferase [Oerskovia sp.]
LRTVSFTAALGRWPGQLLLREIVALGHGRRVLASRVRAARDERRSRAERPPTRDVRQAAESAS